MWCWVPKKVSSGEFFQSVKGVSAPESVCKIRTRAHPGVKSLLFSTTSLRAGWLCPQLHDILEKLERPHDVVVLREEEGKKRRWLELSEALSWEALERWARPQCGFLMQKEVCKGSRNRRKWQGPTEWAIQGKKHLLWS